MAPITVDAIIILVTLFLIYGIFLLWDLFRKGQNYGYFAYFLAVIPVNYLWYLSATVDNIDVLLAYIVLFVLWDITLIRDFFLSVSQERNHVATLLFLAIGILVQFVVAAILPAITIELFDESIVKVWYFYLPQIYTDSFGIASWVNSNYLLAFRVSATLLVLLALVPLIFYLKKSGQQGLIDLIVVDIIFILPFVFLSYIWLAQALGVLTFLFAVILFIALLLITKGKQSA